MWSPYLDLHVVLCGQSHKRYDPKWECDVFSRAVPEMEGRGDGGIHHMMHHMMRVVLLLCSLLVCMYVHACMCVSMFA